MEKTKKKMSRKRKVILVILLAIVVTVVGAGVAFWCSFFPNPFAQSISTNKISEGITSISGNSNVLIVYFSSANNREYSSDEVDAVSSASLTICDSVGYGHAELFALTAQEITGGDMFPIKVIDKYPQNYFDVISQHRGETATAARPELVSYLDSVTTYNTVILIYPNWMSSMSPAVLTFFESYDFSGKTIIPIATSQALGLGSGPELISKACPGAEVSDGLSARDEDDIVEFLTYAGLAQ